MQINLHANYGNGLEKRRKEEKKSWKTNPNPKVEIISTL